MINRILLLFLLYLVLGYSTASAVTSKIMRFSEASEFLKGKTENVIIDSEGTILLARESTTIDCGELLKDIWSINTVTVDSSGNVYLGTSPNGDILTYADDKVTKLYPVCESEIAESSETTDPNSIKADPIIRNEHIFALAFDKGDRLLAGISGTVCKVVRFDKDMTTLFEPEDARYILSLAVDDMGNIYVGTGPNGKIYRLNPFGKEPKLIYTCQDKNVLSLAIDKSGTIYAGCDERGLIYKIDQNSGKATVLYDSEQEEITSLLLDEENQVYVTATSAGVLKEKVQFDPIGSEDSPGKTDSKANGQEKKNNAGTEQKIPNTGEKATASSPKPTQVKRGSLPKTAGHIYRIDPQGFVTDVFSDMSVFFAMTQLNGNLFLATGNDAELFSVDVKTEQKSVVYEDEQSSQITAMAMANHQIFLGLANPPKLVMVADHYVKEGTYTSELIDAAQPARWGKFQMEAGIPESCEVLLSTRSGNVNDPNDPTYSAWTDPVKVSHATDLGCPIGRFCQYKLTLKTTDPKSTAQIRETAVAHVVPNLAPQVTTVKAVLQKGKPGIFQIAWTAADRNKDTLTYIVELRKLGREPWIEVKDELTAVNLEWDSKTVEDGRYQIRVTADDRRSNTAETAMTGTRISDPVIVDNTAPQIEHATTKIDKKSLTIVLALRDEFSVLQSLNYTVDSNEDWIGTLPDDLVYDTMQESFTIKIEHLETGPHVIALKFTDSVDNTGYKTYDLTIQ
ncbi:MAG: hypothetical protein JXA82_03450 [Sedimentisphaerales bacterium]|nr:hypothetical protein [Sedimentisphaerales bacterium]